MASVSYPKFFPDQVMKGEQINLLVNALEANANAATLDNDTITSLPTPFSFTGDINNAQGSLAGVPANTVTALDIYAHATNSASTTIASIVQLNGRLTSGSGATSGYLFGLSTLSGTFNGGIDGITFDITGPTTAAAVAIGNVGIIGVFYDYADLWVLPTGGGANHSQSAIFIGNNTGVQQMSSIPSGLYTIYSTYPYPSSLSGGLYLSTAANLNQAVSALFAGLGVPANGNGNNGDIYFRSDGGASTTIYQRRSGAWVGIV